MNTIPPSAGSGKRLARTGVLRAGRAILAGLACGVATSGDMRIYTVDGLTRVRPHDAPLAAAAAELKAARNEFEPFQIVVHADGRGLRNVRMEASDLRGRGRRVIPRTHLTFYREHYVTVSTPTPRSVEGAGPYPDALIPFVSPLDGHPLENARFRGMPFDVEPDANQPVWIDVRVPKEAAPGTYSGTITVIADNESPHSVPVGLTVWDFALPDTPSMRSNFGGFGDRVAKAHRLSPGSAEFRALERRYAEMLAAHRLCPPIPRYLYPEVRADGTVDPSGSHAALAAWIKEFHVTGLPIDLIGGDPLGRDRGRNVTYLRSMYAYLKTNHWESLAYIYVLDEPNDARAYEEVRQRARLIHEAQPGLKVLCTEQPTPQDKAWGTLVGSVDIWVPLWTLFEAEAAAGRLAAGDELWSYTALCQGGSGRDTPYWEIDFPLLDYRVPAWMSWRHGVTGLLYWTTVYWEKAGDPWTDPATYGEGASHFNGEGSLLYPGGDAGLAGPVASIRLKQIREGLEDYEYLKLLANRGDKPFADAVTSRLAGSWTRWDANPAHLAAAREEIARRILSRSP